MCYERGRTAAEGGVERDQAKAAVWLERGALLGCPRAQHSLALHYSDGNGVEKDDSAAVKWVKMAADQEHPPSMYALGNRHMRGKGVTKDSCEALRLYRESAAGGFQPAKKLLAATQERLSPKDKDKDGAGEGGGAEPGDEVPRQEINECTTTKVVGYKWSQSDTEVEVRRSAEETV